MNTTIGELSKELDTQVVFGKINIRKNRAMVSKYKVSSYPVLLVFSEGNLVNRIKGNITKDDLVAELKSIKPKLDIRKIKTGDATEDKYVVNYAIPSARVGENSPSLPMLVTDNNISQALEEYPFFVVDTFADWCHACQPLNTTLAELARELKGQAIIWTAKWSEK